MAIGRCGQPPALRKGRGRGPETPSPRPTPGVGSRGQGDFGTISGQKPRAEAGGAKG